MCMTTNPGTDGNKRIHGRKTQIPQGIMGIFLEERIVSNVSSNGAIYELEVGSEGRHGNATVKEI